MFSFKRVYLSIPCVLLVAGAFVPAVQAQTVPHREHCRGTITGLLPTDPLPTLLFNGRGNATHFGSYSISGQNELLPTSEAEGEVVNGQFTTTTADRSTISGNYSGTYSINPDGSAVFVVKVFWTSGTGRLAGVTGEADVIAFLDGVNVGDAFEYFTVGTLTLR